MVVLMNTKSNLCYIPMYSSGVFKVMERACKPLLNNGFNNKFIF